MAHAATLPRYRSKQRLSGTLRRRRALALGWCLVSLTAIAAVVTSGALLGPRDDPDLAYQRPGMLDLTTAPFRAPAAIVAVGTPTVVFFVRESQDAAAINSAYAATPALRRAAQIRFVVSAAAGSPGPGALATVADPSGSLAAAFHLRVPRDGGAPVGYALVDRRAMVRYVTLDPQVAESLPEVQMLIEATR